MTTESDAQQVQKIIADLTLEQHGVAPNWTTIRKRVCNYPPFLSKAALSRALYYLTESGLVVRKVTGRDSLFFITPSPQEADE